MTVEKGKDVFKDGKDLLLIPYYKSSHNWKKFYYQKGHKNSRQLAKEQATKLDKKLSKKK